MVWDYCNSRTSFTDASNLRTPLLIKSVIYIYIYVQSAKFVTFSNAMSIELLEGTCSFGEEKVSLTFMNHQKKQKLEICKKFSPAK